MFFSRMTDQWGEGFMDAAVDETLSSVDFQDLYFLDSGTFDAFCGRLSEYVNLQELKFDSMGPAFFERLIQDVNGSFFNALSILGKLRKFSITRCVFDSSDYSDLNGFDDTLKEILATLYNHKYIEHIDLSGNKFTKPLHELVKNASKRYSDEILMNLNLSKILQSFNLPKEIKENVIKPFIGKPSMLNHVRQIMEVREIRRCWFSNAAKRLNAAVNNYNQQDGENGNTVSAAVKAKIDSPR